MKTCFFIGHRDADEALYPLIVQEVERHIVEYGVGEFIAGQYGRFDGMAARAVAEVRALHPGVKLLLLTPYLRNEPIPKRYDGAVYPDGLESVPPRHAISRANAYIIDRCDYIIAHVTRHYGGAWQALSRARRKGKPVVNL